MGTPSQLNNAGICNFRLKLFSRYPNVDICEVTEAENHTKMLSGETAQNSSDPAMFF